MKLRVGIVGLPNVGKSSLFNAITKAGISAENYPFCTIEPNLGIVGVPDSRLYALKEIVGSQKCVESTIDFVDIAGLVKGASKGEGLGNQFLATIRDVSVIAHVVRLFEDDNIIHVDGSVDAVRDIQTINLELLYADMEFVEKLIQNQQKKSKSGDKDSLIRLELYRRILDHLSKGAPVRTLELSDKELACLSGIYFLTSNFSF